MQRITEHTGTTVSDALNEPALIEAFRAGADDAFAAVYRRFYQRVLWFARKYVRDAGDVEDIASETFIQLWKHRGQFTTVDAISAFLHVSVRNKCYDLLRQKEMKASRHSELLHLLKEEDPEPFYIEQLRLELMRKIYAEVEKLPRKMREIFLLSYQEGLKPAEIAERLQISVQTVSNQKVNAIKVLKLALGTEPLALALFVLLDSQGLFCA